MWKMTNRTEKVFLMGCLLVIICSDCMGLRNVRIKVPTAVVRGHDAVLQCLFDLEGEKLYSVKWYRGIAEFFRYSPSEFPPIKQFRIRGLNIRERDSRDTQVVLEKVSKDIGGLFTCEVTADRNFHTAVQTAELKVVELPKKDPYITGLKTRYKLEDALKANCTSEGSDPAANLTWYVNGVPVEEKYVRHHKPAAYKDEKLVSAKSTVRLRVTTDLFNNGKLKLRCSATMYHLYHRSSEKSIELQRKRHRSPYVWLETPTTIEPPFEQWEMPAERPPQATVEFYAPASRSFGGPLLQANFATTYTTLFVVIHQIR